MQLAGSGFYLHTCLLQLIDEIAFCQTLLVSTCFDFSEPLNNIENKFREFTELSVRKSYNDMTYKYYLTKLYKSLNSTGPVIKT